MKNEEKAKKNVHEGHRKRMKEDFKLTGFEGWQDHKVLEYILHTCLPRIDTNEMAHELIDECGGFANVFRMKKEKLMNVYGVGEKVAEYLHMLGEFVHYYNGKRYDPNRLVLDSENCKEYMLDLFDGKEREYFYEICLDSQNRIIAKAMMSEGGFDSLDINLEKMIRFAMQADASRVVLAHNHPSGVLKASNADIVTTQTIYRAFQVCGLVLLDHIIVAGGDCISLRSEGQIAPKNIGKIKS